MLSSNINSKSEETYHEKIHPTLEVKGFEKIFKSMVHHYRKCIFHKISKITKYYDEVYIYESHHKNNNENELLLSGKKTFIEEKDLKTVFQNEPLTQRKALFLDGHFNHSFEIQEMLHLFYEYMPRSARVIIVLYSPYFKKIFEWATYLGLRKEKKSPETFITKKDLKGLATLSNFEVVQLSPTVLFPFYFFGLGAKINSFLIILPFLKKLSITTIAVLRPIKKSTHHPSISIVIPARNEMGNIEAALKRMPVLSSPQEIIFVEGHSQDGTWAEIKRVQELYKNSPFQISSYQQKGKGKADAVRLGFQHATGELLTILDADLTMPPEKLGLFYEAYCSGKADFINGSRLLYPMEGGAMRFLNRCGNVFFAKALSYVLGTELSDSLCGTKLLLRSDYTRFIQWRNDFGDFDPFGDYEIIFPASILGLGIIDIPIRYKARTYGETNISRFKHGWMLLKMTWIGFWKVKLS